MGRQVSRRRFPRKYIAVWFVIAGCLGFKALYGINNRDILHSSKHFPYGCISRPRHLQGKGCKHWSGLSLWPDAISPSLKTWNFSQLGYLLELNFLRILWNLPFPPMFYLPGCKHILHQNNCNYKVVWKLQTNGRAC